MVSTITAECRYRPYRVDDSPVADAVASLALEFTGEHLDSIMPSGLALQLPKAAGEPTG